MTKDLFGRQPLDYISDIPIFSTMDSYIKNYELISEDHLKALSDLRVNPFMPLAQIHESETETRDMVRKHVEPGGAILDAGVGLGGMLSQLNEYDRYGVDISIPYLKEAKSNGIHVAMSKIEDLPYLDGYFDAITSCDVLEHVQKMDSAVEQMLRVLKPDGKLIIRVPNQENLESYLIDGHPYSHVHVRDFSLASLRLYMEKCAGLKCIDFKLINYHFNAFSQLKYRFPSRDSKLRSCLLGFLEQNPGVLEPYEEQSIRNLISSTYEELGDIVIKIRDKIPELFSAVALELVTPLELLAVFRRN
jgi:SAM-dependent methyltransferase